MINRLYIPYSLLLIPKGRGVLGKSVNVGSCHRESTLLCVNCAHLLYELLTCTDITTWPHPSFALVSVTKGNAPGKQRNIQAEKQYLTKDHVVYSGIKSYKTYGLIRGLKK